VICATWNVNSLRARLPRVEEFLADVRPDVLLLQETKCSPEQFPHEAIQGAGYQAVDHSGGRWCGVAVLAPAAADLKLSAAALPGEPNPDEARWIEAIVDGTRVVSVYAPNGREVDSIHYDSKLEFFSVAGARLSELQDGIPTLVGGDMNVAPRDSDVWDTSALEGSTHVTAAERTALSEMTRAGALNDAHDLLLGTEDQQFTWWDYRGGSFHRNFGMRIDHFLLSETLEQRLASCEIARDYRKGEKPSDHVPLVVKFD
jgi:exodeoxyribonuclease-3